MRRSSLWIPFGVAIALSVGASPPPPPSGAIQLFGLDPTDRKAPNEKCDEPACVKLLEMINGAKVSIDFAIYGIRGQPEILEALVEAKGRGVKLRGVVDKDDEDKTYYSDTHALEERIGTIKTDHLHDQQAARTQKEYDPASDRCPRPVGFLGPLQCVGYDLGDKCLVASLASHEELEYDGDIMHDKFFVVDGRYVWTGSANLSDSDVGGYNANVVVWMDSPEMATQYTRELEQMYELGHFHEDKMEYAEQAVYVGDTRVTAWFPPKGDPVGALRRQIQSAQESIDIAIFYFTHKQIAGDVIAAHQRGVKVRVIVDATSATNGYTKHELLRAAGVPVKVENWGGKMHAKSACIDHKVVFAGSMNWTSAGYRSNDENYLRIESPELSAQWTSWYDVLWQDIPDKWLEGRPAPESKDSGSACFDKSDNDFDGKKDAGDEGCGPNPPPQPELPPWKIVPKADGYGLVKGNVGDDGKKVFHVATGEFYPTVQIDPSKGEAFFCSEDDARAAGFKRAFK